MRQYKLISTTAVVVLSVAIISMGGNVYARGDGINSSSGILGMNGIVSPPPTRNYRQNKGNKYQQRQTSGNQQGLLGMNGIVSPPPTRNYRQRGVSE